MEACYRWSGKWSIFWTSVHLCIQIQRHMAIWNWSLGQFQWLTHIFFFCGCCCVVMDVAFIVIVGVVQSERSAFSPSEVFYNAPFLINFYISILNLTQTLDSSFCWHYHFFFCSVNTVWCKSICKYLLSTPTIGTIFPRLQWCNKKYCWVVGLHRPLLKTNNFVTFLTIYWKYVLQKQNYKLNSQFSIPINWMCVLCSSPF